MLRYLSSHPEHREKKLNIKTLSDLPSDVHKQLMQLAKLAAQGIEERRYIFDEVPCESLDLMQSVEDTVKWKTPSSSYTFNHLTLQEFLAALHWSQLPPQQLTELLQRQDLFPVQQYLEGMQHTRKEEEESVGVIHWPVLLFIAGLTTIPPELITPFTGPPDDERD